MIERYRRLPAVLHIISICGVLVAAATPAAAQGVKLALGDVGIGIGPVPRLDGIRLNFRDDHTLERVRGINATIWSPHDGVEGEVIGLALGVPLTGARRLTGIGVAAGLGVHEEFRGLAVAPIGVGVGGTLHGIVVSGIGAGAGEEVSGLLIGGVGIGAGGNVRGLVVGGVGAGAGGDLSGIGIGGLGVGAGGDVTGLVFGGVGVGSGGTIRGVAASVGAVGAGEEINGVGIAGLGIGAGSHLKWVALAGLGIGSPRITGLAAALGVGGEDIEGVVLAPAYFRLSEGGRFRGVAISALNDIRGSQHGLAIGLINITEELHGVQVGLVNIARNKERFSFLPLFNYHP